jgi:hypothetical protein
MEPCDHDAALLAILAAQDGVISSADFRLIGLDRWSAARASARHGLETVTRQVLLSRCHQSALTPVRLALARSRLAVASHSTGAVLWGADGFGPRERHSTAALRHPSVTVPLNGTRAVPGCRVHRTNDLWAHELASVRGIACTDPARTLCDLGSEASPALVERAVEWALRNDQASVAYLRLTVDRLRSRGRRGPSVLAVILDRRGDAAPPTESDAETVFLQAIRRPGQPEPTRQRPVVSPGGESFRVDFAFEGPAFPRPVWIEIDGLDVHSGRDALVRDLHRQNTLMRGHPVLLRFTAGDVYNHAAYVRQETWRHLPPVRR